MSDTIRHYHDGTLVLEKDCYSPVHPLDWIICDVTGYPIRNKNIKKRLKRIDNKKVRRQGKKEIVNYFNEMELELQELIKEWSEYEKELHSYTMDDFDDDFMLRLYGLESEDFDNDVVENDFEEDCMDDPYNDLTLFEPYKESLFEDSEAFSPENPDNPFTEEK
jgi:hypothetical protein